MSPLKISVWKTESTSNFKDATLSRPEPVSIDFFGSGSILPLASLENCMKTKFQNSKYLSPEKSSFGFFAGPYFSPRSYRSSEQGPQGPVSPIAQKFSFSPKRTMRFAGMCFSHKANASSSSLKTETQIL